MNAAKFLPRALFGIVSLVALLGGLGAGLARMGWPIGELSEQRMLIHGPLMICGFLGTLICLERAVALASRSPWSLAVPGINALGAVALLVLGETLPAQLLLVAGSLGLVGMMVYLLRIHPLRYMVVMTLAAFCWLSGNLLWLLGMPIFEVVHWWTAFLILTIVGERLELSRVRRLPASVENALMVAIAAYLAGVLFTAFDLAMGLKLLGSGALLMAVWLLGYDIARRTILRTGVARYIAVCLLVGYGWMAVGGMIAMVSGSLMAGPDYAALLHAFLLGFVFSMIFGHAPIILPAVTGLRFEYHPVFYGHLVLLHVTLVYRMVGYLLRNQEMQHWGGMLNAIAVMIFLAATVITVVRSNRGAPVSVPSQPVLTH
jgi:hypothetical protein